MAELSKASVFIDRLAEALDQDPSVFQDELNLSSIDWDSLAVISTIAIADEIYGKMISGEKIQACSTFAELVLLIEAS